MLLYNNHSYWRIVLERRGSLVLARKNVLLGILLALATFAISHLKKVSSPFVEHISPINSVGWNMMGGTIVFAVVFRTNLGWQRYWEALTQLQFMYSKWADAFTQTVAFVNVSLAKKCDESEETFFLGKLACLQRNFSLLSALAAHRLTHGDVHRMQRRSQVAGWRDQVILRRELRVGPDLTGATELPTLVKVQDKATLNEHLDNSWYSDYYVTDVPCEEEMQLLTDLSDRVHAVMYWVIHDLAEISHKLSIPAPIQSRIYQELSNGMLGFQNAVKISDIPFPFQFTQLFNYLEMALAIFIPIYASTFTGSAVLSATIAYIVFQSILVINQVAVQLETPFGTDVNDISVKDFHARLIEVIIEINPVSRHKCHETKEAERIGNEQKSPRRGSQPQLVETLAPGELHKDGVVRSSPKLRRGNSLLDSLDIQVPQAVANMFGGSPTHMFGGSPTNKSTNMFSGSPTNMFGFSTQTANTGSGPQVVELEQRLRKVQAQLEEAVDAVTSIHVRPIEATESRKQSWREHVESFQISQADRVSKPATERRSQPGCTMTGSLSSQYSQDSEQVDFNATFNNAVTSYDLDFHV